MTTRKRSDDKAPQEAKAARPVVEGKPLTASLSGSAWLPTSKGPFLARAAAVAGVETLSNGKTAVHLFSGSRVVVDAGAVAVVDALAKAERS
jgi:hypothetical protein